MKADGQVQGSGIEKIPEPVSVFFVVLFMDLYGGRIWEPQDVSTHKIEHVELLLVSVSTAGRNHEMTCKRENAVKGNR